MSDFRIICEFLYTGRQFGYFYGSYKNRSNLDIHYFWMNSIIYGGIYGYYFIYILAGMPYADSFCCEYCQGIWRYLIMRMGTKKYAVRKFIIAFAWED